MTLYVSVHFCIMSDKRVNIGQMSLNILLFYISSDSESLWAASQLAALTLSFRSVFGRAIGSSKAQRLVKSKNANDRVILK